MFFLRAARCDRYAILIAGSNTWSNYRHQADIYKQYSMLQERGFDDSHIVQLCYDDLATNSRNKYPGQVFHDVDHKNYYPGASTIDYSSTQVTAQNFYNVITSLPSTSSDYVYIYYDNHGATDILGVPDGCGEYISSEGLASALKTMSDAGHYKYLFFGIEACYSGSVGEVISIPNAVIITAANNAESSYAYQWDSDLSCYLSNEFTYHWIEDIEANPSIQIGTLYDQLVDEVKGSHVCFYGDESMKSMLVSDFIGSTNTIKAKKLVHAAGVPQAYATKAALRAQMSGKDLKLRSSARLALQEYEYLSEKLTATVEEICKILTTNKFEEMKSRFDLKRTPEYFEVLNYFVSKFGKYNADDMGIFVVFRNLAALYPKADIIAAIDAVL